MKLEVTNVTPDLAREYLATSKGNRRLKDDKVRAYARDMLAGNWKLNGETVIFDADGHIVDGHHRLKAITLAGVPVNLAVIRGAPVGVEKTYDMGASRTISDALVYHGHKNTVLVSSIIMAACSIANGSPRSARLSTTEVFEFISRHPGVHDAAKSMARKPLARTGAVLGALHLIAHEMGKGDEIDAFINVLQSGIPSMDGCAAHCLRDRVLRDAAARRPMSMRDVNKIVLSAWEKFQAREPVRMLRPQGVYGINGWKP